MSRYDRHAGPLVGMSRAELALALAEVAVRGSSRTAAAVALREAEAALQAPGAPTTTEDMRRLDAIRAAYEQRWCEVVAQVGPVTVLGVVDCDEEAAA